MEERTYPVISVVTEVEHMNIFTAIKHLTTPKNIAVANVTTLLEKKMPLEHIKI